jgi:hypothetical protein
MHQISSTATASKDRYWLDRAIETKQRLSSAHTCELRAVYSDLLSHYERMAFLCGPVIVRAT